jgi:peptide/nickel transport system permease protein
MAAGLLPRLLGVWDPDRPDVLAAALVLLLVPAAALVAAVLDARRLHEGLGPASDFGRALRRFAANPPAVAGALFVLLLGVCAALAPLLAPRDPFEFTRLLLEPPSHAHWLGTDEIGRDVLSRLLYGARVSLLVAGVAVVLAVSIGTSVGLAAGYAGGALDLLLMRFVDLLLAFPRIFFALLVLALWGSSTWLVILVLGVTGWMSTARLVRAQVLGIREQEYVVAARALGLPGWRILVHHVLPNTWAPVVVSATLMVGNVILAESVLSFLGLGVEIPVPSWGAMLDEARDAWRSAWWLATFPGLAITLTVIGCNLMGDGLRDALDPRISLAAGRSEGA